MNRTLLIKLQPNAEALCHPMERFNAACNALAETAFRKHYTHHLRAKDGFGYASDVGNELCWH